MPHILVVDDDPMLREAYAMLLTAAGHEVWTAVDGQDAFEQYQRQPADLILLDMLMPNMDGVGFLEALDIIHHQQSVKVIIFSNLSTSEKINRAMELGATKHITKSQMTPQQLLTEINNLFSSM